MLNLLRKVGVQLLIETVQYRLPYSGKCISWYEVGVEVEGEGVEVGLNFSPTSASGSFLAEISVRSPRKLFIFIV